MLLAAAGTSCATRRDSSPSLRWVPDPTSPTRATVEVRPSDPRRWDVPSTGYDTPVDRLLRVYARSPRAGTADTVNPDPAMLGTYERGGGVLRFRPAFPLEPGVRYVAVLDFRELPGPSPMLRGALTAEYFVPEPPASPPAGVSRVYPTADTLPENLLKFYVHFSAPMSRGGVYRHVRLVDDSGRDIELPFLELDEELWDPDMTRLTLFIDPGRIKRGVRPLEEIGPALESGKRYTLRIDRSLRDAAGRELGAEFRKPFTVGPPDREAPDPGRWKVTSPRAATRAPLTIEFPDPMDHALAERLIRVTAEGQVVAGEVSVGDGERRWTFAPNEPWRSGRYEIVIQPTIEDLAGNNIGKPFEVDLQSGGEGRPELPPVRLPLEIR